MHGPKRGLAAAVIGGILAVGYKLSGDYIYEKCRQSWLSSRIKGMNAPKKLFRRTEKPIVYYPKLSEKELDSKVMDSNSNSSKPVDTKK